MVTADGANTAAAALVGHCAQLARGMNSVASEAAAASDGDAAAALGVTALPCGDGVPAAEEAAGDEERLCLSYILLVKQLMQVSTESASFRFSLSSPAVPANNHLHCLPDGSDGIDSSTTTWSGVC